MIAKKELPFPEKSVKYNVFCLVSELLKEKNTNKSSSKDRLLKMSTLDEKEFLSVTPKMLDEVIQQKVNEKPSGILFLNIKRKKYEEEIRKKLKDIYDMYYVTHKIPQIKFKKGYSKKI